MASAALANCTRQCFPVALQRRTLARCAAVQGSRRRPRGGGGGGQAYSKETLSARRSLRRAYAARSAFISSAEVPGGYPRMLRHACASLISKFTLLYPSIEAVLVYGAHACRAVSTCNVLLEHKRALTSAAMISLHPRRDPATHSSALTAVALSEKATSHLSVGLKFASYARMAMPRRSCEAPLRCRRRALRTVNDLVAHPHRGRGGPARGPKEAKDVADEACEGHPLQLYAPHCAPLLLAPPLGGASCRQPCGRVRCGGKFGAASASICLILDDDGEDDSSAARPATMAGRGLRARTAMGLPCAMPGSGSPGPRSRGRCVQTPC